MVAKIRYPHFIFVQNQFYNLVNTFSEFKRPELPIDEQLKPPTKRQKRNLGDAVRDTSKVNKFYALSLELVL